MNSMFPFLLFGVLFLSSVLQVVLRTSRQPEKNFHPALVLQTACPPLSRPGHAVSSLSLTREHQAEARARLVAAIHSMPRAKVVLAEDNFLHVEFRSAVFGFVDDVDILFDDGNKVIQVRSASRVGYYDFGVNRRRVEELRKRFMAAGQSNG